MGDKILKVKLIKNNLVYCVYRIYIISHSCEKREIQVSTIAWILWVFEIINFMRYVIT